MASINEKQPLLPLPDVDQRQILKELEDRLIDILLSLDSTHDTVHSLAEKYDEFSRDRALSMAEEEPGASDLVALAFREKLMEVKSYRKKVETLYTKVERTTSLVGHPKPLYVHMKSYIVI